MGLQRGSSLGRLYKQGVGAGRETIHAVGSRRRLPTLAPSAPRGPSSPEAQRFLPARVGFLGGAASGAQGRTARRGR